MSAQTIRGRALAALVTVGLVVGVVAVMSQRAEQDAQVADRAWYGEQWDVARNCVVGTPIGRGEPVDDTAAHVEARAYAALAAIEGGADAEEAWPLRCLGALATLREPPAQASDPTEALARLERALAATLASPLSADEIRTRARRLAEAVARVDAIMPSGAAYDPARHQVEDPGAGWAAIRRSHACPPPAIERRPWLGARVGDERLHDERTLRGVSERLLGEGETLRLARSGPGVDQERPLVRPGLREPRFDGDAHIAWLVAGAPRMVRESIDTGAREEPVDLPIPAVERWVVRRDAIFARAADHAWIIRRAPTLRATTVASPTGAVVRFAADARVAVLLWYADGGWQGRRCAERCGALEPLAAGGDLQLAVHDGRALAVGRGQHSALTFAWILDERGWSTPAPMSRGALRVGDSGFVVLGCAPVRSPDGVTWEPYAAARSGSP